MADDPHLRGVQDRTRISMVQDDEVRYWTEKFGVTRERVATRSPHMFLKRIADVALELNLRESQQPRGRPRIAWQDD